MSLHFLQDGPHTDSRRRVIWHQYELDRKLREIADSLAEDLTRLQYSGRTLTLKLKLETYEVSTRAKTLDNGLLFHTAEQLYTHGKMLLDNEVAARAAAFDDGRPIKGKGRDLRLRLMGLKVSGLRDDAAQKEKSKSALHQVRRMKAPIIFLSHDLLQWAENAASKQSKSKAAMAQSIDLTLDDDSEEDDGFEEIVLQAAPCPTCHRSVAFADGQYEAHIDNCNDRKPSGEMRPRLLAK